MNLPEVITQLTTVDSGIIFVTGPTGSGAGTLIETLAANIPSRVIHRLNVAPPHPTQHSAAVLVASSDLAAAIRALA